MQRLFKDWMPYDNAEITDRYTDPFDLAFLRGFQEDIVEKEFDRDELLEKFYSNIEILEKVAAETYRLASNQAYGTPMDIEVDPYTMSLAGEERAANPNSVMIGRDEYIATEMRHMWIYPYPEEVMA
jgi:hypothetical protein